MCNVWQTISLSLVFQRLSNMYFSDEWKKTDLISVPSDPSWGCTIICLTSHKGFLSVHATKKWRRRKPSRKIPAIWMCNVWQTISLSLLFQRLSNMYFSDEWKKSDLNSVPSEPIWGCKIISLTSYKGFLSVHATKKWRRRKPPRKIPAIWMKQVVTCALYSSHLFLIGTLEYPKSYYPLLTKPFVLSWQGPKEDQYDPFY